MLRGQHLFLSVQGHKLAAYRLFRSDRTMGKTKDARVTAIVPNHLGFQEPPPALTKLGVGSESSCYIFIRHI
jgi:hypothetical protein